MLLKLLIRYLKPYKWSLLGILLLQIASVWATLYLPNLNAQIIDQGVAQGDIPYIWQRGAIMLGISFVQIVASVGATYLAARAAMALGRDLRDAVYDRVVGFSEKDVRGFGAGSLITRNTNDVQQVQMMAMMSATMLVMAPLMAIGGVFMALRQDVGLSWIIAVSVPILLALAGLIIMRLVPLFRAYQEKLDTVNLVMREQLTGVRVIRAFVREQIEEARFRVANTDIMVVGRKVGSLFVTLFPMVNLVLNVTMIAVLWFGGHRMDAGEIEVGTIMAFMQYVAQILFGVLMATFMAVMIPRAEVSAERINEVLVSPESVLEAESPVTTVSEPGRIEFDNVSFAFPDAEEPVIKNVTFTIEPGETVAFIGSTGSGKSTLLNLIPRLFDATEGTVRVGGTDVRKLALNTLWNQLGLVPQKAFLFAGTVASNLEFGLEGATEEQMWTALEVAQGKDFVSDMNGGLQARIAQGGTNVSGGQRQRLAIARALIRRPEILLFDDSFSALDLATDARLREQLRLNFPDTTQVVVAQRISSIMDADKIVVLDQGRVVGLGRHEELAQTCPTYQEIIESQLSAEEIR
ncbi:ABC transporter ATP-binding protein [Scrofimicrobium sp. R131]|uniref:ABC transporter ATP-binding protein n=1 Tax=Scrofimicrobium appendicitidis TaxID=3079930 RepID=A0AAU7VA44_9ACTO